MDMGVLSKHRSIEEKKEKFISFFLKKKIILLPPLPSFLFN